MFLKALGPLTVSAISISVMSAWRLYEPTPERPWSIAQVGHVPPGMWGAQCEGVCHTCAFEVVGIWIKYAHHFILQLPAGLPPLTAGWWLPLRAPAAQLGLAALICLLVRETVVGAHKASMAACCSAQLGDLVFIDLQMSCLCCLCVHAVSGCLRGNVNGQEPGAEKWLRSGCITRHQG